MGNWKIEIKGSGCHHELNEPYPYPNSHNPNSPVIEPTAPEACALPK